MKIKQQTQKNQKANRKVKIAKRKATPICMICMCPLRMVGCELSHFVCVFLSLATDVNRYLHGELQQCRVDSWVGRYHCGRYTVRAHRALSRCK